MCHYFFVNIRNSYIPLQSSTYMRPHVVAARLPDDLYKKFVDYKEKHLHDTDSEALRALLRKVLVELAEQEGDKDVCRSC